MSDTFLSRWARKKQLDNQIASRSQVAAAKSEAALPSNIRPEAPLESSGDQPQSQAAGRLHNEVDLNPSANAVSSTTEEQPPALGEAQALPVGADVRRFMQPNVSEDVRREALQKLFADPLYNVISEMDDYVEDYSNLPNLSRAELKTLNHIKGLFLFEDPPWKIEAEAREREAALNPVVPADVSQEETAANTVTVSPPPPHLGRVRPASGEVVDGEMPSDASSPTVQSADVPLAGRRYQPTRRQEQP